MKALKSHVLVVILVIIILLTSGCSDSDSLDERDYRQYMRSFVQNISAYAKDINPEFIIITQNGHELLTKSGGIPGEPTIASAYLDSIDSVGREDLFYGYDDDNVATPISDRNYMLSFMEIARSNGLTVLVTDYCSTPTFMNDSYEKNAARGYISFAASHRELNNIPAYPEQSYNMNSDDITSLAEARNFLYLINPDLYLDKQDFLSSIAGTNYDVVIVDAFYNGQDLSERDVTALKVKNNGAKRLVIAYMSIGEAEDYRYYWQNDWENNPPSWMAGKNPNWDGNYKVRYWELQWQGIIYGIDNDSANDGDIDNNLDVDNDIGSSYLKRILNAGFDGVYLDIIDAFEHFENL